MPCSRRRTSPGPTTRRRLVRRHALRHLPEARPELAEPIAWIQRFLPRRAAGDRRRGGGPPRDRVPSGLAARPPDTEGPYLQGFIDCLYRDASNRWRVIDYKTNRVKPERLAEAAAGYEMQMYVYALAVERILGEAAGGVDALLLRPGLEHHFVWDAAARRRTAATVDEGIRAIICENGITLPPDARSSAPRRHSFQGGTGAESRRRFRQWQTTSRLRRTAKTGRTTRQRQRQDGQLGVLVGAGRRLPRFHPATQCDVDRFAQATKIARLQHSETLINGLHNALAPGE